MVCILCIPCCLKAQTNQQREDSIKFQSFKGKGKIGLTESQKRDSMMMKDPVKIINSKGEMEIKESSDFFYSFVENCVLKGDICCVHFYPEEAIQAFFKNFTPTIIPEYFLLGTLNIVKDRQETLQDNEVDYYNKNEESIVKYLEEYIKKAFGIKITISKKENKRGMISISSSELNLIINQFFDENTKELKSNLFNSNEEICSYLLGVYYRFGTKINEKILVDDLYLPEREKNANIYIIDSFRIGINKTFSLLNEVCCNNILYSSSSIRGFTPGATRIFFEPSAFLQKYFDSIESEKEILEQERLKHNKTTLKIES